MRNAEATVRIVRISQFTRNFRTFRKIRSGCMVGKLLESNQRPQIVKIYIMPLEEVPVPHSRQPESNSALLVRLTLLPICLLLITCLYGGALSKRIFGCCRVMTLLDALGVGWSGPPSGSQNHRLRHGATPKYGTPKIVTSENRSKPGFRVLYGYISVSWASEYFVFWNRMEKWRSYGP